MRVFIRMFQLLRASQESVCKDDDNDMVSAKVGHAVASPHGIAEGEYYTVPPFHNVASVASVPNFVIVRKGYGSISFNEPVDLTGISSLSSLQEIVKISRGTVSVYPNESEPIPLGTGLNIPAQVSLINLFPPSGIELQLYMKQLQSKSDMEFVFYRPDIGTWVFNVNHFSTYDVGYDRAVRSRYQQILNLILMDLNLQHQFRQHPLCRVRLSLLLHMPFVAP